MCDATLPFERGRQARLPFLSNGVGRQWYPSILMGNLRMYVEILTERAKNTMHGLKIYYSYVWGQTVLSMTNNLYHPEKMADQDRPDILR